MTISITILLFFHISGGQPGLFRCKVIISKLHHLLLSLGLLLLPLSSFSFFPGCPLLLCLMFLFPSFFLLASCSFLLSFFSPLLVFVPVLVLLFVILLVFVLDLVLVLVL